MPDKDPKAQEIIREWERGRGDLTTTLTHCQQVALYLYPDRADFTVERTPGIKRMQYVYASMPLFAHEMGAAGLHSMFTSDTLPWFVTFPLDERLRRDNQVMAWFQAADEADYNTFNDPANNFAPQSHELYMDWLGFGTSCMAMLPHDEMSTFFSTRHLKEVVAFENDLDRVDHLNRRFQWTAKKAVTKWGERAGEAANKALADGKPETKFWYHHRTMPRRDRDPQRADGRNKPFESVYVCEEEQTIIEEGGFDLFPYLYPRLGKIPSETMGRGRGMGALPDIKMANELFRLIHRGAEKQIDPTMQAPDDGYLSPLQSGPGKWIYYRAGLRPTDRAAPILTNGQPQIGMDLLNALYTSIKDWFFNNLLLSPTDPSDPASAGKGVTATFTAKQQQEQMRALSALNSRGAAELTNPAVERVRYNNFRLSQMRRFGPGSPYPPPPPQLAGAKWRARMSSPIALAQRAAELTAIDQLVQRQVQLRQIDPEAPMIIDSEAVIRLEGRDLNVPVGILKSERRLAQEYAAQLRRTEEQHQAETAQTGTAALGNFAQARQQMQDMRAAA